MSKIVDKLRAVTDALKSRFIARDEEIDLAALSLIAQRHMLLIGPPGAAKSALFGDFFARLGGRRGYFALTKGSTPETVLGPISLKAMREQDQLRFNTEGMLPGVEYAIIDEVFKGNSLVRNAMLQVLNEGQFFNGGEIQPCPLLMCGATSNEWPDYNEDAAFLDRFLARCEVNHLGDHQQRMAMVRLSHTRGRGLAQAQEALAYPEIMQLNETMQSVAIPDSLDPLLAQLYDNLRMVDTPIGDRRFAESLQLARASAVYHERDTVLADDLMVFAHTAWQNPEARLDVQRAVLRTVFPEVADATEMFDQIADGFAQFKTSYDQADQAQDHAEKIAAYKQFSLTAQPNLSKMQEIIVQLKAKGRDTTQAEVLYEKAGQRIQEATNLTVLN